MTITEKDYPTVFKALGIIDIDNGMVNRLEPQRIIYEIPRPWSYNLPEYELSLFILSEEDLDTFCCGEHEEIEGLIRSRPYLRLTSIFFNAYFNEWEDVG